MTNSRNPLSFDGIQVHNMREPYTSDMDDNVFVRKIKWYYITRLIGCTVVLYELFSAANSPERGTIILAGLGVLGFDYVARKEKDDPA